MAEHGSTLYENGLDARLKTIAARLGDIVIDSRFRKQRRLYLVGALTGGQINYGQIVERQVTAESPGLPAGALKCVDLEVNCALQEGHLAVIDRFLAAGHDSRGPLALAGFQVNDLTYDTDHAPSTPDEAFHPKVEGYDWYRAYQVAIDTGEALLFDSWMQPWGEGGSPFPILYTLGDPDIVQVRAVANAYKEYRTQ